MPAQQRPRPNGDFSAIRAEFRLPGEHPTAALVEAEAALSAPPGPRADATALPLVTIDPPGAKDLDQAQLIERRSGGGYRVHYAIADLGLFVRPGGPLDVEARRRGQTLYLPDGPVPLHPPVLSEGAASLLPGEVRPAVLWTVDCDAAGVTERARVRRALVRSVAQLDYDSVRAALAAGNPHPSCALLPELGRLRRELAVARGAVELQLPEQQVVPERDGGWRLILRARVDVEAWNAELSLLTGMAAAELMLAAGTGVLRTLPDPEPEAMASLRRRAQSLAIDWPPGHSAAQVLAGLDPARGETLAFHVDATRLLRGAGYTVLGADPPATRPAANQPAGPDQPPAGHTNGAAAGPAGSSPDRQATNGQIGGAAAGHPGGGTAAGHTGNGAAADPARLSPARAVGVSHAGLGAPYAHVTAPIRRLVDRFGAEVCLAVAAGAEVPDWVRAALPELPGLMATSDLLAARVDKACLSQAEAWMLAGRVGEVFPAVVLHAEAHSGEVFVAEPPVVARCTGDELPEGERIRVRLAEVDPARRKVAFTRDQP